MRCFGYFINFIWLGNGPQLLDSHNGSAWLLQPALWLDAASGPLPLRAAGRRPQLPDPSSLREAGPQAGAAAAAQLPVPSTLREADPQTAAAAASQLPVPDSLRGARSGGLNGSALLLPAGGLDLRRQVVLLILPPVITAANMQDKSEPVGSRQGVRPREALERACLIEPFRRPPSPTVNAPK